MTFDQFMRLLDVLKWPVVFLTVALVVILLFRAQLATFFSRITSIGKEGLKIGPTTGQQSQPDRTKQAQELMRALDSTALLEQECLVKADLEKRGLEHTGETIDVLVRHLAGYQLAVAFEEIYRLIFGSQIYILKRANATRPLTRASVEEHFRDTQTLFPAFADGDVDQYMSFLLNRGLLQRTGTDYLINPWDGVSQLDGENGRGRIQTVVTAPQRRTDFAQNTRLLLTPKTNKVVHRCRSISPAIPTRKPRSRRPTPTHSTFTNVHPRYLPQQRFHFRPLPHEQRALRPITDSLAVL